MHICQKKVLFCQIFFIFDVPDSVTTMLKEIKIIALLSIIPWTIVTGQHLSHQVLVPAAGVVAAGQVFYSQTIGETAVELVGTGNFELTQGFQQPIIRFFPGSPKGGTGVEVYPNPAVDHVKVEFYGDNARSFMIYVINITGTVAFTRRVQFSSEYWHIEQLDMSRLGIGLYFVRIVSDDAAINRSFKIEKL